ncbi:MAG TPA: heme exporter protein CcmB [Alphaproteobacteria bacterium]
MIKLLRYEIRQYWSGSGSALLSLGCYFILTFLMGYATQNHPASENLSGISPALAFQWVAMIVSSLLAIERIWLDDARDHLLAQQRLSPYSTLFFITLKSGAFWICIFLPLLIVFGVQSALSSGQAEIIPVIPFLLASISITLLLVLAGALALGSRNGMLISLVIILPLLVPPLTFGLGAHLAIQQGIDVLPALSLLSAYALFNLVLVPCAVHYVLSHTRNS